MKIFRWSAMVLTAAIGAVVGCSSGGCGGGGTNINSNSSSPAVTCGSGTVQQGGFCQKTTNVNTN